MRTVFFDIDTQIDFLFPAGALYVPGAERLLPAFTSLNRYAAAQGIPLVSTTDAHAENDAEFRNWSPHCIAGTVGQQKPAGTLLERRVAIPAAAGEFAMEGAQQVVVEKQALDLFTNPNLPALLERLRPERCVVYGVVTEYCVRCAAMGLLRLGGRVELVTDAIQTLRREDSEQTLQDFTAAGGILTRVGSVLS